MGMAWSRLSHRVDSRDAHGVCDSADLRELVTIAPLGGPPRGSPTRAVPATHADADLHRLLAIVIDRRGAMHGELRLPVKNQRRAVVQRRLLAALESYTSALSARRLVVPPRLRDELALQRG